MIGEVVKRLRERQGWSQRELAEASGVGQSYISMLEQGQRPKPGAEILHKLATSLGTTVDGLIKAAEGITEFPAEELSAAGLPDALIARYARLWDRFPARRNALLEAAHKLARDYAELYRFEQQLRDEPGSTDQIVPQV